MSANSVCGRIPPTIARLESLKYINLSDNHISGPIPVELGSLLQLQTIQLQGNNLRGTCKVVSSPRHHSTVAFVHHDGTTVPSRYTQQAS